MNAAPNPDLPGPESLQGALRFLLMRFARTPCAAVAENIAACAEALLAHPDFRAQGDERCGYQHLLRYWRAVSFNFQGP